MPPGTETCPGVTCQQCAQNAVLIAELWEQLNAKDEEIARLRALVAVGREMAFALEHGLATIRADGRESLCGIHISLAEAAIAKWRRLERV